MNTEPVKHFEHCHWHEGSLCSCGAGNQLNESQQTDQRAAGGKQFSTYRHPKHNAIVRMLTEDDPTNLEVAEALHVARTTVARVRAMLNLPRRTRSTPIGDKLDKYSTEPDKDGHQLWTGRRGTGGAPVIRHCGVERPAAAVAFELRTGRKPVGFSRPDCGTPHCMAPAHILDDVERRDLRLLTRFMMGLGGHWDACPQAGHPWDTEGRVEPDLSLYCRACGSARAKARRERIAEASRNEGVEG